jgi:hypothetical protein
MSRRLTLGRTTYVAPLEQQFAHAQEMYATLGEALSGSVEESRRRSKVVSEVVSGWRQSADSLPEALFA